MCRSAEDLLRERALQRLLFFKSLSSGLFIGQVIRAYELLEETVMSGKKILVFGNGGSAAEAQHFAAELVCMFGKKRRALPAMALTTDSSILTAQSNDFGFETIFSRQIEALARSGDLVIGLTTSDAEDGNLHSANILNGFLAAKLAGARSIGLFSQKTKNLLGLVDVAIAVPSENTAIIQEGHLFIIHMLCELIESELF